MAALTAEDVKRIVDLALQEHELRERDNFEQAMCALKFELVPGGAAEQHKRYHQELIDASVAAKEAENARKKVYEAILLRVVSGGVAGLLSLARVLALMALLGAAAKLGFTVPGWVWSILQ